MASITRESNGRKTIQFVGTDRRRQSLRLGKASMETAAWVKGYVERIVGARKQRVPLDALTAAWLGSLDDEMHDKVAGVGLVDPRPRIEKKRAGGTEVDPCESEEDDDKLPADGKPIDPALLGGLLKTYGRAGLKVKQTTRTVWRNTRRNLRTFFGSNKPIAEITEADADEWAEWLSVKQHLAETTVRRRCGIAKQFFKFAKKKGLVPSNVFVELKATVPDNRDRDHFIPIEHAERILDACPDHEWRLLFALSRFGGLRCPSEHLALPWNNIDWQNDRMTVLSPKTEHRPGGESRVVPIFPELRPHLEMAWERAPEGAKFVIGRYRSSESNLRTQFSKIVQRAGLVPWPKIFHNLRATRQTELEDLFPTHVVCKWLGNSPRTARKSYLQVTEAHFKKAVQNPVQSGPKVVQNPVHQARPSSATETQEPLVLQGFSEESADIMAVPEWSLLDSNQ